MGRYKYIIKVIKAHYVRLETLSHKRHMHSTFHPEFTGTTDLALQDLALTWSKNNDPKLDFFCKRW